MEAPKCKICGERHYGLCRTEPPAKAAGPRRPNGDAAREERRMASEPTLFDEPGSVKAGHNAYMREYMRGWRAKRKAQPK
jgi:hypothetical protein